MSILVEKQSKLTKILNKVNNDDVLSQAYMLYANDESLLNEYALLFSKVLICPQKYENNCTKCNICKRISSNSFGELHIIEPINGLIKKEEIINIKNKFNTNSIEGKNQVYIIKSPEKMNDAAANSLLKFLEEPDSNTVCIFTTTNLDAVINTIVSRCQIIKLNNYEEKRGIEYVKKISLLNEDEISLALEFAFDIENNIDKAKYKIKNYTDVFSTKEKLKNMFNTLILIYKDILNYKLFNKMLYFEDETGIKNISETVLDGIIIKKISCILDNINKLNYNVNISLFMMNFLVEMGEISNDKSSRS